jgi:hypothetical protein
MWYGYVGPGMFHVTKNYQVIDRLAALFPYSKYRKFRTEEEAWEFITRNGKRPELKNVVRYGDTFENHYVTVDYIITEDTVFYNVSTSKLGYIKLISDDSNFVIENRTDMITVRLKNIFLNKDMISSHAIAIYHILKLLGNYIDVEVIVPDHSIFYMLTIYTGSKPTILKLKKLIGSRQGKLSVTLLNWGTAE